MFVTLVALVLAFAVVGGIIAIDRRRSAAPGAASRGTLPAWSSLGLGLLSLVAVAWPLLMSRVAASGAEDGAAASGSPLLPLASISFSLAGLALAIYALKRGDRHWSAWVGLVASAVTVAFWLYFLIGSLLFPA